MSSGRSFLRPFFVIAQPNLHERAASRRVDGDYLGGKSLTPIASALEPFPRAKLLTGPTPIEPLHRLSEELGIDLWIKRDDLAGLGFGGNKIRQLEYYFGAALSQGADTVLITGAVQSNYVRSAAAAAAKLGLKAILQLEKRVPREDPIYDHSGNVLLGEILGAEHIHYPVGEDEDGADRALRDRADQLRSEGRTPFVIPLGLNNKPTGALGYVRAAQELIEQGAKFDAIVVASGSGLTHGGLISGLRLGGIDVPVYGSCVRRDRAQQEARMREVCDRIASLLGTNQIVSDEDIQIWDGALAPGYGQIGEASHEAMLLMARKEGLFLDPVYTAKSFAGVVGLAREGVISPDSRVLFVHTGGQPAIFAYGDDVRAQGL